MARTPRKYYSLLVRDGSLGCPWSIEFGAYELATVKSERLDYRDQGFKASELMIITTAPDQEAVHAEVIRINREAGYYCDMEGSLT